MHYLLLTLFQISFPVLGYLDDVIILPALRALCVGCIPREIFENCRLRAEGMWDSGKPKKWYYAIPFVLIWLAVVALVILASPVVKILF